MDLKSKLNLIKKLKAGTAIHTFYVKIKKISRKNLIWKKLLEKNYQLN